MQGGRSFAEEQSWTARYALEKNQEKHVVAKLPCCGAMVEITDLSSDNFVVCPNPACRKRHVVLNGAKHEIKSE